MQKKGKKRDLKFLMAVNTLIGTIVGAGILGIPYVVAKVGFLYGLFVIIGVGLAALAINLFYGEVVLRTKEQHQLVGYAEKYFGSKGKKIASISMLITIYGALSAYLIGEGATLHNIFNIFNPLTFSLIFFVIAATIVFKGIKNIGKTEMFLIGFLFITVFLIGIFSFNQINFEYLKGGNITKILIPYGVILFAYLSLPSIPELQEELGRKKKIMKKVIIIGSIIPIFLYIIFTIIVIGVIGLANFELLAPNDRIATIALSVYSQPILGLFANLLAVFAMFSSFLTLSMGMVEIFHFDYKFPKISSYALTFSIPLLITIFNISTFITILGITGAVAGGIEGILVVFLFWKAKKAGKRKPEYQLGTHRILGIILILMFVIGVLYSLWNFFIPLLV